MISSVGKNEGVKKRKICDGSNIGRLTKNGGSSEYLGKCVRDLPEVINQSGDMVRDQICTLKQQYKGNSQKVK